MESWRNPNHFSQLLQSRRARWIPKNPIFNWITLLSATLSSLFSPAQRHIPIPSFLQLFLPLFFPLLEVGSPEGLFVFFGGSSWHSAPGIFPCAPCSNNHTSTPSWNKAGLHLGEGYDNQGEIRDHIWNWEKLVNFHEKSMRSWNDFFFFFPRGGRKLISKSTSSELTPVCGNFDIHYLLLTFSRAAEKAALEHSRMAQHPHRIFISHKKTRGEKSKLIFFFLACSGNHLLLKTTQMVVGIKAFSWLFFFFNFIFFKAPGFAGGWNSWKAQSKKTNKQTKRGCVSPGGQVTLLAYSSPSLGMLNHISGSSQAANFLVRLLFVTA